MFERIVKATEKLPMHIKVILAEKTEKVTFANGYFEILVSKDDSIFENEIEPFYRLCKELSKNLNLKGSTLIFDDKRFSYMMLYTAKKLTELKEKDHEVKESYLKLPIW